MKSKIQINYKKLKAVEKSFNISLKEMKKIMKDFRAEMDKGLAGDKSSLKMLPAYADIPTGLEKGKFIALDLGGTNFRVVEIELKGGGRAKVTGTTEFKLDKRCISGSADELFDFLAERVKIAVKKFGITADNTVKAGFTFSFPMAQTGINTGRLVMWTKGFSAKGVIGKNVVGLLKEALARKGLNNIEVEALANDTVGTLAAGSYEDKSCDIGVILGTGTNACYREHFPQGHIIINTEWGNFNKLRLTPYDRLLDKKSHKPGEQKLEKMVSGMYLGEISSIVLRGLGLLDKNKSIKTEEMSVIESGKPTVVKKVCGLVSGRASRISAAAIAAIVKKIDPPLKRIHIIAIDGSLYEKHPYFAKNMKKALKELFGRKASRIRTALTKDGSGKGAAIIAAIAVYGEFTRERKSCNVKLY